MNYNLMNSQDIFAQIFFSPMKNLTVRADVHHIILAEDDDLYYVGAGPTQDSGGITGFVGRPNLSGDSEVLTVIEAMATYKFTKWLSAGAYYGHSFGGDVIDGIFAEDDDADYFFAEMSIKFN